MSYPSWVSMADRALAAAARQIKLIRAVTPINADGELALLERAFRRGTPRLPRWRYDPPDLPADLLRALDGLAAFLEKEPPFGPIYAARARELRLEAELVAATGTRRLTAIARERFIGTRSEERDAAREADELARAWTAGAVGDARRARAGPTRSVQLVRSCDANDPRSLVSRLSREVGRKKLPLRVSVQAGMASLAATGDGVILVAANKLLRRRDVDRTVLHEIEGHALPRARAARAPLALFAVGTARGIDDQEGRAIALEEEAGFLDDARKFELGCRHLGACATLDGAGFVDVVALLKGLGASIESALRIAARVQRGSHGDGGLGREVVYLPARCKLQRLARSPEGLKIEEVMRGGRIAADVALLLAALLDEPSGKVGPFRPAVREQSAVSNAAR
jgi:hypothetical protein